jgi:hypothetical protein
MRTRLGAALGRAVTHRRRHVASRTAAGKRANRRLPRTAQRDPLPPRFRFGKLVNSKASIAQRSDGSLLGAACLSHVSATETIELIREAIGHDLKRLLSRRSLFPKQIQIDRIRRSFAPIRGY